MGDEAVGTEERRLQQKREFEDMDTVKLDSTNCPLSYGFDEPPNSTTPKGPWNKVTYEQYKQLDANRPKNNPHYNKVRDPVDQSSKIMMTAERCDAIAQARSGTKG